MVNKLVCEDRLIFTQNNSMLHFCSIGSWLLLVNLVLCKYAPIAQWIEQQSSKLWVESSILSWGTR